ILKGTALYGDLAIALIGLELGEDANENLNRYYDMPETDRYRKAERHVLQAEELNNSIVNLVERKVAHQSNETQDQDTNKAMTEKAGEERGESETIADSLKVMAGLKVPVISIVIGEGSSGGAIALGVGNHVNMLENSTYSVISPEGAAALLWKDSGLARQAAESMQITAPDLKQLGVIDEIIPEPKGGAHRDISLQADRIGETLRTSLQTLRPLSKSALLENRWDKYKVMGSLKDTP